MAVTDCSEIAEGRGGDLTIDDDNDTRVYNVTCSLATDDKYTILASGLLPALLSDHPKNGTRPQNRRLYLRRYRIRQLHGNFIWRVECEYARRNSLRKPSLCRCCGGSIAGWFRKRTGGR